MARILEMEDRRSAGAGELAGFLAPSQPLPIRVRAALAAGRIGSPVTTPYDLIGALRDPQPELKRMAVFALGEMDDTKAAPLLALALEDADPGTRAMAAEALGKLKDTASVPALMTHMKDPDVDVAGMTLLALWKIDAKDALPRQVETAAALYESSSGDLRWRAAYFLMRAMMGHPEEEIIETALAKTAADPEPLIRSYAARGLGASRSAESTQSLIDLADDADWRVRVNAFNGLKTRRVEAEGLVKKRWRVYKKALSDKNTGVALAALAALETCGAADAASYLTRTLTDKRPRFREVAAQALATRDKTAALPAIAPLASDPVWSVRARTAEALAVIPGAQAAELLARLAADSDPRVRSVAVGSLARTRPEHADELIAAALADEDLFVRVAALEALVPAGTPPAGTPPPGPPPPGPPASGAERERILDALSAGLARARTDTQNDASLAALDALGRMGGDTARAHVESALDNQDYLVRRRAVEILRDVFHVDRADKLGGPAVTRTAADYLEAVARARRRVTATLDTAAGVIVVELFPAEAPLTVDNYIRLARDGKLDGLAFHRVVPNFVIQDGDPRGDGNGGPPWQIRCEINLRRYVTGAMGMALSGKDTGGSQYFITHSPQPHLDGGYTIFGQVISGQAAVDAMVQGDAVHRVTIQETPES